MFNQKNAVSIFDVVLKTGRVEKVVVCIGIEFNLKRRKERTSSMGIDCHADPDKLGQEGATG